MFFLDRRSSRPVDADGRPTDAGIQAGAMADFACAASVPGSSGCDFGTKRAGHCSCSRKTCNVRPTRSRLSGLSLSAVSPSCANTDSQSQSYPRECHAARRRVVVQNAMTRLRDHVFAVAQLGGYVPDSLGHWRFEFCSNRFCWSASPTMSTTITTTAGPGGFAPCIGSDRPFPASRLPLSSDRKGQPDLVTQFLASSTQPIRAGPPRRLRRHWQPTSAAGWSCRGRAAARVIVRAEDHDGPTRLAADNVPDRGSAIFDFCSSVVQPNSGVVKGYSRRLRARRRAVGEPQLHLGVDVGEGGWPVNSSGLAAHLAGE